MDKKLLNAAILSATAGFVLGYALRQRDFKRLNDRFEQDVAEASAKEKEYFDTQAEKYRQKIREMESAMAEINKDALAYAAKAEKDAFASVQKVEQEYKEALARYKAEQELVSSASQLPESVVAEAIANDVVTPEQHRQNLAMPVDAAVDTFGPRAALPQHARREVVDKSKPYIVTSDEALQNETGYGDATYTYYAGDNTLVDEAEDPMTDADRLMNVGTNIPDGFGQLSGDDNVVYIRNDRLRMYMEVVRNESTYAQVAGLGEYE